MTFKYILETLTNWNLIGLILQSFCYKVDNIFSFNYIIYIKLGT